MAGELHELLPSDPLVAAGFGSFVAVDGTTVVVGAQASTHNGSWSGAAYVFDAVSGNELFKLLPNDGAADDAFGRCAVSGTNVVVGAFGNDDNGNGSGSAYVFETVTGGQVFKLLPSDGAADDFFGGAVAVDATTAVIGAAFDGDNGSASGSAYLFDVTTGAQLHKLLPSDGAAGDQFGRAVSISGDLVLVGAPGDDDQGTTAGSAYVFNRATGQQLQKLLPHSGSGQAFGNAVAIEGTIALVGAPARDNSNLGVAHLFDASTGVRLATLSPNDATDHDAFGGAVAIEGGVAIVGSFGHEHGYQVPNAGSVYVFDSLLGTPLGERTPSTSIADVFFGSSVAIAEGTVVVGTDLGNSAYVFTESYGTFCDDLDNGLASCPCSPGTPNTGCDIQQATGGVGLRMLASETTPQNRVTWSGFGFPAMSTPTAIVIRSTSREPAPALFGDGLRCIGVPVVRLGATFAAGGSATPPHGHSSMAGQGTFYYQLWFRNTPIMYCDPLAAFNLSNGVSLAW
jgi:hypothetical protein